MLIGEIFNLFCLNAGNTASKISVLAYVTHELVTEKNEVVSSATFSDENCMPAAAVNSFRLCMANVLISTSQKISYPGKKQFAEKVIPCLIHSVEVFKSLFTIPFSSKRLKIVGCLCCTCAAIFYD